MQWFIQKYICIVITYPKRMLLIYNTYMCPVSIVKVKMSIPIVEAPQSPTAVSLKRWVLSKTMPNVTDPSIPANTITNPILPTSSFAP